MPHAHARGFPSPCPGLSRNHPWSLGCGHFPQRWRDRGGQAPALRGKTVLHRRAWALGCHTRIRAGFPRQRPRNPTLAGDRPPRYGNIKTRRSLLPVNRNFAPKCFPVVQFLRNVNPDEVVKGDEGKRGGAREEGSLAVRNANCFIRQAILHDTQRLQACRPCAGR